MSGFDWSSDSDIVLRAYGSIAVHENPNGDVVVRQERGQLEDKDQTVCIPIQDAEYIAKAIVDKAKEIRTLSPAERQAKHDGEDREPRLALPAPNGRTPTVPQNRNGGTGTKAGAAHE
jgi:hypothetical protein